MTPPPNHNRSSSIMLFWVILFWNICLRASSSEIQSKLKFFSSEKITFRHSLALMDWYWRSYFTCFSLCFIVNLRRSNLFLCLNFSLFDFWLFWYCKELPREILIILMLNFSFLLHEQFFSWIVVIIFLVCLSVLLFHTYLDFSSNYK